LNWTTQNEINTKYFSIEKSADGQNFFETGRISAAGNSSTALNYNYTDNAACYFDSPTYYRIVTVDVDGKKSYSEIKNVLFKTNDTYVKNVFPNPVKPGGQLQIQIESQKGMTANLNIISVDGKYLKKVSLKVFKGSNTFYISIPANLATGMVLADFYLDGKKQQIPVIVSN